MEKMKLAYEILYNTKYHWKKECVKLRLISITLFVFISLCLYYHCYRYYLFALLLFILFMYFFMGGI